MNDYYDGLDESKVKKVIIIEGIASIDIGALSFYVNLDFIIMPNSLASIGFRLFAICHNL